MYPANQALENCLVFLRIKKYTDTYVFDTINLKWWNQKLYYTNYAKYPLISMIKCPCFFDLTYSQRLGQKSWKNISEEIRDLTAKDIGQNLGTLGRHMGHCTDIAQTLGRHWADIGKKTLGSHQADIGQILGRQCSPPYIF